MTTGQHPAAPWLFRLSAVLWVVWGLDYALPPGPQMTYICAVAIITSFLALYLSKAD